MGEWEVSVDVRIDLVGEGPLEKICVICDEDCSGKPRTKDRHGRYYCAACYEKAIRAQREKRPEARRHPTPAAKEPAPALGMIDHNMMAEFADEAAAASESVPAEATFNCPGCDQPLPLGTKICVNCGINVETGRSIVTSRRLDENLVYSNTERILRWVSWLLPFGFSPLASEAMGMRRPFTTWAVVLLTILVTFWFWFSTSAQMNTRKDLMLWSGSAPLTAEHIKMNYQWTDWGDADALDAAIMRATDEAEASNSDRIDMDRIIVEAHDTLTPNQQFVGRFQSHQLLTHALLHGDIFHLAGNLIFLLILGARVNCLIGNIATVIVYPLLAVAAAGIQMLTSADTEPMAMLGASGAIMGMAGMYLVLFPVNRMHMSAWFRWWFYFRIKFWTMRGCWAVLAFIAFDVLYILIGMETGTAHWAHVGGFLVGVAVALGLLLGRVLDAGGGDLLSVVLGRHAWKLIGRPGTSDRVGLRLPGV